MPRQKQSPATFTGLIIIYIYVAIDKAALTLDPFWFNPLALGLFCLALDLDSTVTNFCDLVDMLELSLDIQ